ncbi:MAG TPA: EAL domain-containing protein [Thermoanaerobaculia bacterium]|nr:EAL domain-containing protein [Thermoanaerobaculia bacterium]
MQRVSLRDLIAGDRIEVQFQPIFDISVGTHPWAVEALAHGPAETTFGTAAVLFDYVRLKHEEIGTDRHCVLTAIREASKLPGDVRISLNVHAVTIEKDEGFADFVAAGARQCGIDPKRLILEIVEQSRYWRTEAVQRGIVRLRRQGLAVALDDIGRGFCNYQMIVDLQPEYLKLDRYFVHGCAEERARIAVLRSIHGLARDIGAQVVAEGVETLDELATVRSVGIGLAQGFVLARPMPVEDMAMQLAPPCAV